MRNRFWLYLVVPFVVPICAVAVEKLCWAHYVGWGFDQVNGYDRAALDPHWSLQKFNDRSLLGRHAQTDEGVGEATKLQVRTAIQYGIDGFCVDLPIRADTRETIYADAMARFHRAAEGTAFKVAPCVDGTSPDPDLLIRAFAAYLERWQHHPNTCLVGGRPVIFIYNSRPRTLAEWRQIIDALKARGLAAYWLVQPMGEGTLWGNAQALADNLAVFDGLYDFGINGFTSAQMLERLDNGRRALEQHRPGGLLVAGITQGYLGNANSFYRPYLNTGTLRDTWQAAVASGAPWVCLTTWNDYVEHTHFEPSAVGRDVLLRVNRDCVARWRGETAPPRPPQVFLSYHEEASLGDDWTLEILNLSYTTEPASLCVRLLDETGAPVFEPAPVPLPADRLAAETLRVPEIGADGKRLFRVQARLATAALTNDWRELYPVAVRYGHLESLRTIRVPLDSLAAEPRLTLADENGVRAAKIRFDRWNTAGRVELLRNGWPVAETNLAHKGAPSVTFSLPLPAPAATPADLFIVRYSTLSGDVAWSAPAVSVGRGSAPSHTAQPVIVTGADFDEGWWGSAARSRFAQPHMEQRGTGILPVLRPTSRFAQPRVEQLPVAEAETYALTYPMTDGSDSTALPSHSGWQTPLLLGGDHKGMRRTDGRTPSWTTDAGQPALRFDGADDCAILPSRAMPYGAFTLECNVRPAQTDRAMTLFADTCGVSLGLLPDGKPRLIRKKTEIVGSRALTADRWTHIAAVYDGVRLALFIDGALDAEAPAEPHMIRINSLPVVGNTHAGTAGFCGLFGGFHLQSGIRAPGRFALAPRAAPENAEHPSRNAR
jgi:hypothetical protein